MKFTLKLLSAPTQNQSQLNAYQFAANCLQLGHEIQQVFFYSEAIHVANKLISPAQDELNIQKLWQDLSHKHNVPLVACIAAASRRGVLDLSESKRHNKDANNLADHFELAGLGQFIEASVLADRVITFG